jgi:exodeoxyribonuclease-3
VRIATWNVNGLRARLEFLVLWLRERRPDLVGLQELKLTEEQFPHALLELCIGQSFTEGLCRTASAPR